MGYNTSRGLWVDSLEVNLNPLEGVLTQDGYSAVVEMGGKRSLALSLDVDSVSTDDTVDITIETSRDGVNWHAAATFTQVTGTVDTHNQWQGCVVDRFVRAHFDVGGTGVSIPLRLAGEAV